MANAENAGMLKMANAESAENTESAGNTETRN